MQVVALTTWWKCIQCKAALMTNYDKSQSLPVSTNHPVNKHGKNKSSYKTNHPVSNTEKQIIL